MKKVALVDDTFVVPETEFDEDTRSADSFKNRILNTKLIIDKTRTSFKSQRPDQSMSHDDDDGFDMAELPTDHQNVLENDSS